MPVLGRAVRPGAERGRGTVGTRVLKMFFFLLGGWGLFWWLLYFFKTIFWWFSGLCSGRLSVVFGFR